MGEAKFLKKLPKKGAAPEWILFRHFLERRRQTELLVLQSGKRFHFASLQKLPYVIETMRKAAGGLRGPRFARVQGFRAWEIARSLGPNYFSDGALQMPAR